jgi:hypothetical protein
MNEVEETKPKKVYISGPITGHELLGQRALFSETAKRLQSQGYAVFNPLQNGLSPDAPYEDHMKADLKQLLECDYIFQLPNWRYSVGCCLEFHVAMATGILPLNP